MSLEKGAKTILEQCLAVKHDENIVIITDDKKYNIGKSLYKQAKQISDRVVLMIIKPREISGTEPPKPVAAAMKEADVVLCPTTASLTHTQARLEAVEQGARVATMPGITEEMFSKGPIRADYNQVARLTGRVTNLLDEANFATIITGDNYQLKLSLAGRKGISSQGIYKNPGESGNLPSGESYIAPLENEGQGKIIINGSIVGLGLLEEEVIFNIEQGKIIGIEGDHSIQLEDIFPEVEESRMIGELGIGTNPLARVTGIILEDEKIYGSVHIAFGTNITFGGNLQAGSHIDCVTLKPTLYLDNDLLIEKGEFNEEVLS